MKLILPDIHNLDQHVFTFLNHPERYRPKRCPHCGRSGLWIHGRYWRNAKCEKNVGCAAPVPRFLCPHKDCGRTCSVLPEYISPLRWYHWAIQQVALMMLWLGNSLMYACNMLPQVLPKYPKTPEISTIHRWHQSIKCQFLMHRLHLCNAQPELGRYSTCAAFWRACLKKMWLSRAMFMINQSGHPIP